MPVVAASTPQPVAPATSAGGVLGATASPPRMLEPFPVVRIKGWLTAQGAQVTLLTVRAPRGVRITVRCRGASCPRARWAHTAALTRLRRFEGALAAGTELQISVTRPGWIGKSTTIVIRRGRAPLRRDRCLFPGKARPQRCPAR